MLVFVSVFKVYACMHLFSLSFCHELNKVYSLSNIIVAKHYTNDPEACCREMFKHWLNGNGVKPCSWRKLIELFEDCDFDVLAEQVNSIFTA